MARPLPVRRPDAPHPNPDTPTQHPRKARPRRVSQPAAISRHRQHLTITSTAEKPSLQPGPPPTGMGDSKGMGMLVKGRNFVSRISWKGHENHQMLTDRS